MATSRVRGSGQDRFFMIEVHTRYIVATFACRTLPKTLMRVLECEHAQESHHKTRGSGQSKDSGVRMIRAPTSKGGGETRE